MNFNNLDILIKKLGPDFPSGKCLTLHDQDNVFSCQINQVLPKDKFGFGLYYACQYFYSLYITPYGFENVKKSISRIRNSKKRKWAEYFIEQANDIKIAANRDFEFDLYEIADNLDISFDILNSVFNPYKPFLFLKDYVGYGVANLSNDNFEYFYILLLIYFKNQCLTKEEYIETQRYIANVFQQCNKELAVYKLFEVFKQINQSRYLDEKLSLSFNDILYNSSYPPLNGELFVSWTNVIFWDGYYFIYHPLFPNGDKGKFPLRIEDSSSRRVFNNLQKHFIKKLNPIYVKAVDGRIKEVYNHQNLSECISIIEKKIYSTEKNSNKSDDVQSQKKYLSKNEAKDIIKQNKSNCYVEYLCNEHLEDYKVVYCTENRVNSNDNITTEHSFIFTIKGKGDNLKLAFENVEISRCTYIFNTCKKTWSEDIDSISDFFMSNMVNKRLKIAQKRTDSSLFEDKDYIRIFHKDYYKWKQDLKE